MVYELSDNYTGQEIKKFGRDWTNMVEGILKSKI
jgi:hypothetical protein